ncbi:hypothetical protein [uncultured phage MedDCM-OCT-S04-C24]|uniref:Uncharacterized protein n=1 Tax=uncultured phage MedDCM-OCT-S04-C24 TaxID=743543 RepID=D6PH05_9CAUD|nr:hypothetical protein HOT85_gp26 [uncultured phage MedDCM-OCT-S04-C24]ADD95006.1 hypothetical protein [uncultured phage MedDCM-OCT-S04-C24]
MAETFTMNETPAEPEILNSDEKESLAIAESLEQGEQPLLAGKFKDTEALEQAYVELQKNLENHVMKYSQPKTRASLHRKNQKSKKAQTEKSLAKSKPTT